MRGLSVRGARRSARTGVLRLYVEHGGQAQRRNDGAIACLRRQVVRNAIVEYCREKGLGAPHMYLRGDFEQAQQAKLRGQLNKYDMRMTVGLRTPRTDDDLPKYEAAVKALSEMDGRIICVHDPFSGRRYEQFKNVAEFHEFDAMCKDRGTARAQPVLHKYKMPLVDRESQGMALRRNSSSGSKSTGSEYIGVCLDMINNVSLIETPMQTIETLAPYTLCVSFKDVAVDFYEEGLAAIGGSLRRRSQRSARHRSPAPEGETRTVLFLLEMITRDPLKVPIFTEQYWKVYDDKSPVPPRDLAMLVDWVRKHPPKKPLPRISGLTPEQRLAFEDACNQQCIDYAREKLPL